MSDARTQNGSADGTEGRRARSAGKVVRFPTSAVESHFGYVVRQINEGEAAVVRRRGGAKAEPPVTPSPFFTLANKLQVLCLTKRGAAKVVEGLIDRLLAGTPKN